MALYILGFQSKIKNDEKVNLAVMKMLPPISAFMEAYAEEQV
jgi:hypothetical protein